MLLLLAISGVTETYRGRSRCYGEIGSSVLMSTLANPSFYVCVRRCDIVVLGAEAVYWLTKPARAQAGEAEECALQLL